MGQSPSSCLRSPDAAVEQRSDVQPGKICDQHPNPKVENSANRGRADGPLPRNIPTSSPATSIKPAAPNMSNNRQANAVQSTIDTCNSSRQKKKKLLSYVVRDRERRRSSSCDIIDGDSASMMDQQKNICKKDGLGSNGGGILNFLLATDDDADSSDCIPKPEDMMVQDDTGRLSSPKARKPFSPRSSSRRCQSDARETDKKLPAPTKTKLYRRDPLVLEHFGLDVTDEATVAGTQIYAARVMASASTDVNDNDLLQPVGLLGIAEDTAMLNIPCDVDGTTLDIPVASPHPSESRDETSFLLLPQQSGDTCGAKSKRRSRATRHRRFTLFGWSSRRSRSGEESICNCHLYGNRCGLHHSQSNISNRFHQHQMLPHKLETPSPHRARYYESLPIYPRGCASFLFTREAVKNNQADPVDDIVCVNEEHRIYVADIGLTAQDCQSIINVAERCSRGTYAAYTYAKQTLGCRDYDEVASICVGPVMTATATIMEKLEEPYVEDGEDGKELGTDVDEDGTDSSDEDNPDEKVDLTSELPPMQERRPDPAPVQRPRYKRQLVLDDREPHLVKYDVTRKERQKLDMHTDKSEWTFLISLSEGCGADFRGGGTYFEAIDSTVHLSRGQALIFPGKLRHRGQKITAGRRFLLVGFLVDKKEEARKAAVSSPSKMKASALKPPS